MKDSKKNEFLSRCRVLNEFLSRCVFLVFQSREALNKSY